jgi:molybdate transport system substrate-binding protein
MRIISRFTARALILICLLVVGRTAYAEEKLTIAAAADLKFALDQIVAVSKSAHPAAQIEPVRASNSSWQWAWKCLRK